jgi:hypothetical protein
MTYEAYDPVFDETTAADEADRRLLAPRPCAECGTFMDNGLSDTCAWCCEEEETDEEPI